MQKQEMSEMLPHAEEFEQKWISDICL